jgi:radical SAM superfamily enzyme YgiQ (UPF0313 family)
MPLNILLLSTYELGHQPLGLAQPAAHLAAAGHLVRCQDLAVDSLNEPWVRESDLIGISVPMHTAARLGVRLISRLRGLNPGAHLCFYGLYAALHAEELLAAGADATIGGEVETPLVALADELDSARGQSSPENARTVFLGRQSSLVPKRTMLPPLERYARLQINEEQRLAGYVEASRGCAHRCRHCPIPPVYGGRMRIVSEDVVLADIRQLVAMGARHITFGDPDFFNGIKHSLRIVERFHHEFPSLTYDATIKIEHILEHRTHLPGLASTGCLFIVSAAESVQDHVLAHLNKGHTAADVDRAIEITRCAGVALRPTLVAFTPWTSMDDYLELLDFVASRGLANSVDPIQLAIRLLVPSGSWLMDDGPMSPFVTGFDHEGLTHRWIHPDPRVDHLQKLVIGIVERATEQDAAPLATFQQIRSAAWREAGRSPDVAPPLEPAAHVSVPRLTEPWFC